MATDTTKILIGLLVLFVLASICTIITLRSPRERRRDLACVYGIILVILAYGIGLNILPLATSLLLDSVLITSVSGELSMPQTHQ